MPSPPDSTRRERWIRVGLLAASALVSLIVLEVALRLLGVAPPPPAAAERDGGFSFFAPDPRLGWDLVPGARDRHRSPEFDVEIAITGQGLRESRTYGPEPAPGVERIVVLGDSFTFGHGVEEAEGWTSRIERRSARPLEVVNLAVTGYGLDQQLLRLEDRGWDLDPDRVLVGLFLGDVFRTARREYQGYAKPWFEIVGGRLELAGVPVPATPAPPGPSARLAIGRLVAGRGRDLAEHLGFGVAWKRSAALLGRLADEARERGVEVAVVVVPKDHAVLGSGLRRRLHERALARLERTIRGAGLAPVDTTPSLRAAAGEETLYYASDGHWTAAAHRIAAEAVAQALEIPLRPEAAS